MGTNNPLPTYSFTLNDKDIRYGIIRISKHKDWFPANSDITIICKNENGDSEKYRKRIPSGGNYISGLTKQHCNNKATPGTTVAITKTENGYSLEYKHDKKSCDDLITDVIESSRCAIEACSWAFFKNETNVRTEIIDPILRKLNWRFPINFYRELVCYNGGNVDYALHNDNCFCILIEAKSIDEDIDKAKQQLINYMKDPRFNGCIGIITNGMIWKVIDNDEQNNELVTISLSDNDFIEFIQVFNKNNFDIKTARNKLRTLYREEPQNTFNEKGFDIIDKGKIISGKDSTNKLNHFVKDHLEEVLDLENKKLFNVTVISSQLNDFREKTRNKCKKEAAELNKKKYYITRDHSTLQKRMIVQQIIYLLELNASIEDCK